MNTPRVLTLCILLFCAQALSAQTVTGSIVDPAGLALSGATISFSGAGPTVISSLTGVFSAIVPVGTYEVTIEPPATIAGGLLVPIRLFDFLVQAGTNTVGMVMLPVGHDVTGTVQLSTGALVSGGDIDVFDPVTGQKLYTPNDNTNAFGVFTIRLPSGTFDIRCEPLPGQSFVAQRILGVQVAALPVNMGVITLPAGVALSGTVLSLSTGAPLAGIDIDVDDRATGLRVETPGDDTNALGVFSVIVPLGTFQVTFDPPAGTPFVSQRVDFVTVAAATNMGTTSLVPGFVVTGTVLGFSGAPVSAADLDAETVLGGMRIFTSHDSTDANGLFSITVPAGDYVLSAAATSGTALASAVSPVVVVTQHTALAAPIVLPQGHVLSGVITTVGGTPVAGADIGIHASATGAPYPTEGGVTDATGAYTTVVPAGVWDVVVAAPPFSMAQDQTFTSVTVSSATTVNAALSKVPMFIYTEFSVPVDPVVLIPGQPLSLNVAFHNPNPFTTSALIDVEVKDPAGGVLTLANGVPFILGPGGTLLYLFSQLNLPAASPGHLGFPSEFTIRLRDPLTLARIDSSCFPFIRL